MVAAYRDRIPDSENITIETIHSAMRIIREYDNVVEHCPPSRLRKYDIIFIDEGSQIEPQVWKLMYLAILELPQRPVLCMAADFQQLQSIKKDGGGPWYSVYGANSRWKIIELDVVYRTTDRHLLEFLSICRKTQPTKRQLLDFWAGHVWDYDLYEAVAWSMHIPKFLWLCVTNKGCEQVNQCGLYEWKLKNPVSAHNSFVYGRDPKYAVKGYESTLLVASGIVMRITRNLDKDRGMVNGATGVVQEVFPNSFSFTLLLDTGVMVLVHPIAYRKGQRGDDEDDEYERTDVEADKASKYGAFLPCTYGWATTIRRAQGMTLTAGCIWMDHCFPPERGYGYVALSRFKTFCHVYYYKLVRRTDWLPVGVWSEGEQEDRGAESDEYSYDRNSAMRSAYAEFADSDDDYGEKPSMGWSQLCMGDIDGEADIEELELYADGHVEFHGGIFDDGDLTEAPDLYLAEILSWGEE